MTDSRYEQAKTLHEQGQTAEASAILVDLLADEPGNAGARYALAVCLIDLGQEQDAESHLRQVLTDSPQHCGAAYLLGRLLQAQGDYHHAAAAFRQALTVTDFQDSQDRLRDCEAAMMQASPAPTSLGSGNDAANQGPIPIRKVIETSHVADRGKPTGKVRLQVRHLIPSAVRALIVAIVVASIPTIVVGLAGAVGRAAYPNSYGTPPAGAVQIYGNLYSRRVTNFLDNSSLSIVLIWLSVAAWIYLAITILAIPIKSRMYAADLFEYGMDVRTGIIRRSKQFVWYYQITEAPTYTRKLTNYLTHTASLQFSYNNTASTTARAELTGIGSPKQVEEIRAYLQSRIPSERLPIRGPWT